MKKIWAVGKGGKKPIGTEDELRGLLLKQRGIRQKEADHFFESIYERDIHDPMLFYDMETAVDRIYRAIEKQEQIVVYGDYDADGISSTAILVSTLRDLGAIVSPYIPHRADDGYGLNFSVLEKLASVMDLLITVDCGISNAEEVAKLKKLKKDVIITDHHSIPSVIPEAVAVVHPQHSNKPYLCPWLSGAGVAWKLSSALLRDKRSPFVNDPDKEKWLLDLAALGTIADVVPLTGENRTIVRFGLEVLRRTRRPGIAALLDAAVSSRSLITEELVAFRVVPRLNAAGRMDHAQPALELLMTNDQRRVEPLIKHLNDYNQQRQSVTKRIMSEAEQQLKGQNPTCVVVYNETWPAGVVGLAANRLSEAYGVPAVVIGRNGSRWVGSARSPEGVNVLEVLSTGKEFLEKLGGHAQAAGFTVISDKVQRFRELLSSYQPSITEEVVSETADAIVEHRLVSRSAARMLDRFAPYGHGNERPRFVLQNVTMAEWRTVGKQAEHAKLSFILDDDFVDGIGFGMAKKLKDISGKVDVLGEIGEDEWRGQWRLQVSVKDIAPAGSVRIKEIKK